MLAQSEVVAAAVPLLGFSKPAADYFVNYPDDLIALADRRPRDVSDLRDEAALAVAASGPLEGLRRFRRVATYRLAVRDLAGEPVDAVMFELTAIAEAALQIAAHEATG